MEGKYLQLNPRLLWMHMTSWKGPYLTWIFACMFSGIIKEVERIAPSVETFGAPSVPGAEASVFSPSGAELGVMQLVKMKAQQLEERWVPWEKREQVTGVGVGGW